MDEKKQCQLAIFITFKNYSSLEMMEKKEKTPQESKKRRGIILFKENIEKISEKKEIRDEKAEEESTESKQFMIKLCLIGDGAVGKTSIRRRYLGKGFLKEHLATLGADFAVKEKNIDDYYIRFQIWDIAGQEFFKRVRSRFYRGCFGALAVFDITRRDTFLNLTNWLDELYQHNGRGVIPVIILANKTDLADREVSLEEAQSFVDRLNDKTKSEGIENFFLETSAKTGKNIEQAFDIIGNYIVSKYAK
ncbi:MAG: Rab family GTPase [Candidatus Heimdallarchaeaceae archaeon]